MITFLASPKAFKDIADYNQRNAISSWLAIHPDVEVILYGNSPGTEKICEEYGLQYVPDIKANNVGIPYFNSIVEHARQHAAYDTQIFLNCDILMNGLLLNAIENISFKEFLMVGQRIDLHEGVRFNIHDRCWKTELLQLLQQDKMSLHTPSGVDYFVFRRGMWEHLAPLVIGRGAYDSALIAYCLRQRIPVIDATFDVIALHQFHDYGHVAGGLKEVAFGSEAMDNRRLHGITYSLPNTADANWQIRNGMLVQSNARGDRIRSIELYFRFVKQWDIFGKGLRSIWRVLNAVGVCNEKQYSINEVLDALMAESKSDSKFGRVEISG